MEKSPGKTRWRFNPYDDSWPSGSSSAQQESEEPRQEQAGRGDPIQRVALIVGVTGVVGTTLAHLLSNPNVAGGPWKFYGLARTPKPEWFSYQGLEYVQCDLFDRDDTFAKLSELQDVTHLFYVQLVVPDIEMEIITYNCTMLQNTVDALLPHAKNLQHIVLETSASHYFGSWTLPDEVPFVEDGARLPPVKTYYTMEDTIFQAAKQKSGLTYSIHRPSFMIGISPGNLNTIVGTLAVYATICKHEGMPLVYPGNQFTWDHLFDAADANLVAEQELWACLEPKAHDKAFNVANGDVFKWKRMWHLLGETFGVEVREYSGILVPLEEQMKGKEAVWDKIVQDNHLFPSSLAEICNWRAVDTNFTLEVQYVHNMNKSKELGFLQWRDSETSFLRVFDKMRKYKLIP